jgi:hypothetical protein
MGTKGSRSAPLVLTLLLRGGLAYACAIFFHCIPHVSRMTPSCVLHDSQMSHPNKLTSSSGPCGLHHRSTRTEAAQCRQASSAGRGSCHPRAQ